MPDDAADRLARIVEARMKLRERFKAETSASPSLADPSPLGSGPPNRHGMPRLPVEQVEANKWPVLDLGVKPEVSHERWRLTVDGACRRPVELDWQAFQSLEQIADVSDFHCVTKWSKLDIAWRGVRLSDVIALAEPTDNARHVMLHAYDRYTTNLSLAEALKPDVLLVHTADGKPLSRDHGGPVRVITPQLYAWKGAKWIQRIELMVADRPGFWEERGYSNTAYPWRNDRYS
ncbi:MAG TPA: molybdopterin-dependent oxidoreductase [Kofleriaceae bacterium]|jgi:DMSO/TMAO reductase YedYZ molybdopterin-dependent catalytic subunit|nr:molybdopterin-dependent oxidoreductase [Kofleriaceae bacterium]